jgi:hypothetical protein
MTSNFCKSYETGFWNVEYWINRFGRCVSTGRPIKIWRSAENSLYGVRCPPHGVRSRGTVLHSRTTRRSLTAQAKCESANYGRQYVLSWR